MSNYSKVYIITDSRSTSGGVESMHQLASEINDIEKKSYIYYRDLGEKGNINSIPDKFRGYNLQVASAIEDEKENILIVPEVYTEELYKYRKIKKCIWWLSLDYYFDAISILSTAKRIEKLGRLPKAIYPLIIVALGIKRFPYRHFKFKQDKNNFMHFYNCEYIRQYLLRMGVKEENTCYLCGPIREEYLKGKEHAFKEVMVAFNPAKGLNFTNKIIKYTAALNNSISFVPLAGMNPQQMAETLGKSSVYIDFGSFPGPERIPREAVMQFCNLVISTSGSAYNDIDVPIPRQYKFDAKESNLADICKTIIELCNNYKLYVPKYDIYREKVRSQKAIFEDTVLKYFG
jgi:hypothetical protein